LPDNHFARKEILGENLGKSFFQPTPHTMAVFDLMTRISSGRYETNVFNKFQVK
jgi:hypothetical protein